MIRDEKIGYRVMYERTTARIGNWHNLTESERDKVAEELGELMGAIDLGDLPEGYKHSLNKLRIKFNTLVTGRPMRYSGKGIK